MAVLQLVDGSWFLGAVRPVRFWPYTTFVTGRIIEMPFRHSDPLDQLRGDLVRLFTSEKVHASIDNKTVFEVDDEHGRRWCLGFYDLKFVLGTSCRRTV